jgi:hypothetical protein
MTQAAPFEKRNADAKAQRPVQEGRRPSRLLVGRYTGQGLWTLFLMSALPLHAWTMILAFRDLSWLTERTNAWDAVGVLSYGLLFALVESALLFVVVALLGLIVPRRWEPERRIALLSVLVLVLCVWAMLSQLYFLANVRLPAWVIGVLVRSGHPLWVVYGVLMVVVGATFGVPAWLLLRRGSGLRWMGGMLERLGLLAMFYLVFDVAALVIVVLRNL